MRFIDSTNGKIEGGGAKEVRTPDLFDANESLSQLSYSPAHRNILAEQSRGCQRCTLAATIH